jgi:hypothetical protein
MARQSDSRACRRAVTATAARTVASSSAIRWWPCGSSVDAVSTSRQNLAVGREGDSGDPQWKQRDAGTVMAAYRDGVQRRRRRRWMVGVSMGLGTCKGVREQ